MELPNAVALSAAALFTTSIMLFIKKSSGKNKNFAFFQKYKSLSIKDSLIIDMLESLGSDASWVLTDPELADNPIVHTSDGFCQLTKYDRSEILGRNCRFLQGDATRPEDVKSIANAVKERKEISICLTNYTKEGIQFENQFFLAPLFDEDGKVAFFIGVQLQVQGKDSNKDSLNPGWQVFNWL